MAGKRHHFIPQFLQKGFSSHVNGNEAYTWVYRKDQKAYNTNVKNVGVESQFYSNGDSGLDDSITDFEGGMARLVSKLRKESSVIQSDVALIAQFISHLEVRTRHLRQNFFSAGNFMFNEVMDYLDDPSLCEKFCRQRIKSDPSLIEEVLAEVVSEQGLPQNILSGIKLDNSFKETIIQNMISEMPIMVSYFRSVMKEKIVEASKNGHIKALTKSVAPDIKTRRFEKLSYVLVESEKISLPLGDSIVFYHLSGEREFKPFLECDDDLNAVILPISSHQLLVGSVGDFKLDFSVLKRAIADCSLEYFISSECSEENKQLSNHISENSHLLSESDIENLIEEVMNDV